MSDIFYKPKKGGKIRILPSFIENMDFSSLYPSVIKISKRTRKSKIKNILSKIYDSGRN